MTEQDNSVAAILKRAKARLETKGWTQGYMARDAAGVPCNYKEASCYCGMGAVSSDAPNYGQRTPNHAKAVRYLDNAAGDRWDNDYVSFNDHPSTTLPEVLAMFDVAIAAASE